MMIKIGSCSIGKREERRLERRQAILAVAATSFLDNGYAGTTMSAISAQLGGSKGTLWNHFSSKEELFAAFLDEKTALFKQEMMQVLELSRDLKPALETFTRRFIEKISLPDSIKLYRLVVGESGRSPEIGHMFYERAPGAAEAMLARFLADHMRAGHLRTTDPVRAARALFGLAVGSGHQQMLSGGPRIDPASIAGEAVRIVEMFLRLYAPEDTAGS